MKLQPYKAYFNPSPKLLKLVRANMSAKNLTEADLCQMTQISRPTVKKFLAGGSVSRGTVLDICRVIGINGAIAISLGQDYGEPS